jgi:hypothetical protein
MGIGVDASTMEANAALRTIVRREDGRTYRGRCRRPCLIEAGLQQRAVMACWLRQSPVETCCMAGFSIAQLFPRLAPRRLAVVGIAKLKF